MQQRVSETPKKNLINNKKEVKRKKKEIPTDQDLHLLGRFL
jgi:hypothetical protein